MSESDDEPDEIRDGPTFDQSHLFRPIVDPINGVQLDSMIALLKVSPAERLRLNTGAARNVVRLRDAARGLR